MVGYVSAATLIFNREGVGKHLLKVFLSSLHVQVSDVNFRSKSKND